MTPFSSVNLNDPRQDVHRERVVRPTLNRFRVAERLVKRLQPDDTVLEVGGGAGEFSQRLRQLGFNVTFVDLSPSNVARAKGLGFEAHQLDLNQGLKGLPDSAYSAVIMLEIIEHIVASEALLREANRVLKSDGVLILSTPNFAYWLNRFRILLGNLSHDEGYHFRFFTPSVLRSRIESAGFTIEQTAHTTPALGVNLARRLLGKKDRLHFHVPNFLAPFFAHTLFVCARKRS